jgi:hypothetical protein
MSALEGTGFFPAVGRHAARLSILPRGGAYARFRQQFAQRGEAGVKRQSPFEPHQESPLPKPGVQGNMN